jgi:hypothetical protein
MTHVSAPLPLGTSTLNLILLPGFRGAGCDPDGSVGIRAPYFTGTAIGFSWFPRSGVDGEEDGTRIFDQLLASPWVLRPRDGDTYWPVVHATLGAFVSL